MYCNSVIRAHKNDLLEHTRTLKHQRNFQQNTDPEMFNTFVMDLNGLKKEGGSSAANTPTCKRNSSASASVSNSKTIVKVEDANSLNGDNAEDSQSYPPSSIPYQQLKAMSGASSLSGFQTVKQEILPANGNLLSGSSVNILENDTWQADEAGDYVNVVLEEPHPSPATSVDSNLNVEMKRTLYSMIQNLHNELSSNNGDENSDEDANSYQEQIDNDYRYMNMFMTAIPPHGDSFAGELFADSTELESRIDPAFNADDVVRAIINGRFNLQDLILIIKNAATKMEQTGINGRSSSISGESLMPQSQAQLANEAARDESPSPSVLARIENKVKPQAKKRKRTHSEDDLQS